MTTQTLTAGAARMPLRAYEFGGRPTGTPPAGGAGPDGVTVANHDRPNARPRLTMVALP
jgi:hypothetical protein